jgi:hypothetical protein
MRQGGNRYLLTEAVVARRGTTFKIAAVNTAAASLTISGTGLTALSSTRDPARGGWIVTVPPNGTVGIYTATIDTGTWSKSMPIYVIFELPTDLTQAEVAAYLYDDDPANKRDEIAVWWRAVDWKYFNNDALTLPESPCNPGDPICSNWQYHTMSGYAQAFWTEQFTKKVLVDYTLPAVNGISNLYNAAQAIGLKSDQSVRVNFASVKNSFSSATRVFTHVDGSFSSNGGACETNAGVQTAMLRSVGIASRPFAMDYNKTVGVHGEGGDTGSFEYDHAVMMWVKKVSDPTNLWYAERNFLGAENEYQSTPVWSSGTTGIRLLAEVGSVTNPFRNFQDYKSDLIQSVNAGWNFQNGSLGGGTVNTAWDGVDVPAAEFAFQNRDFKWNSKKPLEIQQSPHVDIYNCQLWKGDGWAPSEWYEPANPHYASDPAGRTAASTYFLPVGIPTGPGDIENWPYNPKPTSCSDSTSQAACDAFKAAWQTSCAALPGQTIAGVLPEQMQQIQPVIPALDPSLQLGSILSTNGLDQNNDGRFEQLVVSFDLTSARAGAYQMGGWLRAGDQLIQADISLVDLTAGLQTLQLVFDGQQIGDNHVDGPYQVEAIWIAPADQPVSEQALPEEMAAYQTYTYATDTYQASNFSVRAASIAGNYSYTGTDTNSNGRIDSITVSVPLSISMPGTFTVEADLYDGQGGFVAHAEWTGSGPIASLDFALAGKLPPYSLEHVNLLDARGVELNTFYAPVYKIEDLAGQVDTGELVLAGNTTGFALQSITPSAIFTLTPVDLNANGRYDQLVVSTTVNVIGAGGIYTMEGLLVDDRGIPVLWTVSDPQTLSVGPNQTLQMTFDARMLFDQLPLVASQKFTLIAVKIFNGTPGPATLEADIPVTGAATAAYSRLQLEPSSLAIRLFQDDLESGTAKWNITANSQWSQTNSTWQSWTYAWKAVGSTTKNGVLALATPLDLTNHASPWLIFNSAYQIPGTESVKLEVSTNGTTWTAIRTYTGSTTYWSTEIVDLSAYGKTANVRLRFNAQSTAGTVWYIDDIFLLALPPMYPVYLPAVNR